MAAGVVDSAALGEPRQGLIGAGMQTRAKRLLGVLVAAVALGGTLAALMLSLRSGRLDAFDQRAIESSAYMVVSDQDARSDPPEVTAARKRLHGMNLNPEW